MLDIKHMMMVRMHGKPTRFNCKYQQIPAQHSIVKKLRLAKCQILLQDEVLLVAFELLLYYCHVKWLFKTRFMNSHFY